MADPKDSKQQFEDLKKQIKLLNDEIKRLGGDAYTNLDNIFKGFNGDIKNAQKFVKQLHKDVDDLKDVFGNISTTLRNVVNDLIGTKNPVKETAKAYDKLEDLARKLRDHANDEYVLSIKQLKETQRKVNVEIENLKIQQQQLILKSKANKLTDEEKSTLNEINYSLEEKQGYVDQLNEETAKTLHLEKEIKKTVGFTGKIFEGISGTLQKIGIESEYFEELQNNIRLTAKNTGSGIAVIGTAVKGIFKGLGEALKDPLVQVALLTALTKKIYHIFTEYNKEAVDLARNFSLSTKEGAKLQHHFEEITVSSNNFNATVPNLTAAFIALNNVAGSFVNFSAETLNTYNDLTKSLGLSAETAGTFFKLSLLTKKSFKGTSEEIIGQVKYQKEQLHTSLSEKVIMEGIAKSTAAQRLSLRGGTEALIQSVIQAKKLGLEINQLEGIADSLLDIESSIAAEQSAELITNRELNVEAARYYANTNQTQKLAEVLSQDVGTSAQFLKMSRIESQMLAAAYGLQRDQMAEILESKEIQDQLNKLNVESEEELAQKLSSKQLTLKQIQELGSKELADRALNLSFQEKLNTLMEKFKTAVGVELSPYFDKFTKKFDDFMKDGGLQKFIDGIKTLAHGIGKAIDLLTSKTFLTILGGLAGLKILRGLGNAIFGTPGSSPMRPMFTREIGPSGMVPGGPGGMGMFGRFAPGAYKEFTKSGAYTLGGQAFSAQGKLLSPQAAKAVFAAQRTAAPASMGTKMMRSFGNFGVSKLGRFMGGPGGLIAGLAIDPLTSAISDSLKGPKGKATTASDTVDVLGGTASGALTGAAIGSVIPVVGTAIGAIVGGALGLFSGLSDIDDRKKAEVKAKKEAANAAARANYKSKEQVASTLVSKYQSFGGSPGTNQEGTEKTNSLLEGIYNAVSTSKPIMMNGNQVGVGVGFDNYQMQ